jgi:hypothetical protein
MKACKRIGPGYSITAQIRDCLFGAHPVLSITRPEAKKKRKVDVEICAAMNLYSTLEAQGPTRESRIICSWQSPPRDQG